MIVKTPQSDKTEGAFRQQLQKKLEEYKDQTNPPVEESLPVVTLKPPPVKELSEKAKKLAKLKASRRPVIKRGAGKKLSDKKDEKKEIKKRKEEHENYEGPPCEIMAIDRIYCLNLESCKERKDHMKKLFKRKKWNVTFIKGIYPRHPEYRSKYGNSHWIDQTWDKSRCYCKKHCDHKARRLRPTEVAIAMSHYHIYKKIVKHQARWSLICEDDLLFVKPFMEILTQKIPPELWLREEPVIIFLGGANDNIGLQYQDPEEFELVQMPYGCYSNYCFLINYAAAKFLAKKVYPITRPDDSLKRYWIGMDEIEGYRIKPSMVAELSAGTNTKAVYNRWSRGRAPPRITALPEDEYAPKPVEEPDKPKRLIVFNKTRYTVMKEDPKKKKERLRKAREKADQEKKERALLKGEIRIGPDFFKQVTTDSDQMVALDSDIKKESNKIEETKIVEEASEEMNLESAVAISVEE